MARPGLRLLHDGARGGPVPREPGRDGLAALADEDHRRVRLDPADGAADVLEHRLAEALDESLRPGSGEARPLPRREDHGEEAAPGPGRGAGTGRRGVLRHRLPTRTRGPEG